MYVAHWAALAWHIVRALCAPEDALSVGNDNWGLQLHLSRSPQECAPLHLFFNITRSPDAPKNIVLPDAAAVSFLTPDSAQDAWMILQPLDGAGVLEWVCPLRAGKQFIVRGVGDYEQLFTVAARKPPLPSECGQGAPTVTSSSPYGTLIDEVFHSYTAASYGPTSITPANQFAATSFPIGQFSTYEVHLGAAVSTSSPSPGTADSNSTNIGAIVGGVVGGLAAIALGIVLFLLRRRRKRKQALVEVTPAEPLPVVEAGDATTMATGSSHITPMSRADRKRAHAMEMIYPTAGTELSGSTQVGRDDVTEMHETETTLTNTGTNLYPSGTTDIDAPPPEYSRTASH
ncbi:hypothetical protein AURDEDRAFT_112166 [Auricularia subglabra TFB-10046 SS5]|nr:hypothetical protein AURDEDRAFT_112166 [Auricularia subglabra TFB-10046 SS5]